MNKEEPPLTKRAISGPFGEIVGSIIGFEDPIQCAPVGETLAYVLAAADKDEQFIHIEFPNDLNNLTRPVLWRIQDWRTTSYRRSILVQHDDMERTISHAEKTIRAKLSVYFKTLIGDTLTDKQQAALHAKVEKKIKDRDYAMFKALDVDLQMLENLQEADKALAEFNKKRKAK